MKKKILPESNVLYIPITPRPSQNLQEDTYFKPFKGKFKDNDSFNLSLDMGAKASIEERIKDIRDYYNAFKIEINKDYFLNNLENNKKQRRKSARFISINQKNAFNFDIEGNKSSSKNLKTSIMNTSIDQHNSNKKGELFDDMSHNSDIGKRKLSGFFSGTKNENLPNETDFNLKRNSSGDKNIFSNEIKKYKNFPLTKFQQKFSLDVNEYQVPKKALNESKSSNLDKMPSDVFKTHIALYDNKILEESYSKGGSPVIKNEKTISSKVHPSPHMRSNSLNEIKHKERVITSLAHANYNMEVSKNSNDNNFSNTFKRVHPEQLNHLVQKQNQVPLQNKSMFPNREFSKLHKSNNILPNSEDLRNLKIGQKAKIKSNVRQFRFQNYQTIVSLKSEMNLQTRKKNYKKMQRQVLKNFRHPQSPFMEGRQVFKSSSSIESGDSDQEMKLEKAYCIICGEGFG